VPYNTLITTETLATHLHAGWLIADCRYDLQSGTWGEDEYVAGHIPGALNLDAPASAAVASVERLVSGDKSKALVLYCNGPFCQASRQLSEQLVAAGFTNVR